MKTHIALLRGINVSGQKKIQMADLRRMFEKLPFEAVETYIQSGNVVFKSNGLNTTELQETIKKEIAITFGFDVPVLVKQLSDFEQILNSNPFTDPEDLEAKRIYYVLLKNAPTQDDISSLHQEKYPNELFKITPNCVYLNCRKGAGNAKLTNNIIEKKLKVVATARNHRTMLKLLKMASS